MKNIKYVFLGGIFPKLQNKYIKENSIGAIQNAADALQKKIIDGLDKLTGTGILLINLPFIGSFPRLFKSAYLPSTKEKIGTKSTVIGAGFINIFFVKIISRFLSSFFYLFKFCRKGDKILFIYSAHLPFILSSILIRTINPSTKICLILPDLPEYMGEGNFIYRFFKRIDGALFLLCTKKIDYFVVLTKYMAEKINLNMHKVVVIEGIASENSFNSTKEKEEFGIKSFLYTGTLARRYGITDLIDAFSKIEKSCIELWICGDGDGKDYVSSAAKRDNRIKFFGQIGRDEVIDLQSKASVLINPRTPEGEFTKYSFPSKIMEYMASGRPVIMHKLDGIPDEYDPYYISPNGIDINALSECIITVAEMKENELSEIGIKAKNFILREKNPLTQAKKILNLVMEKH